MGSDERHFNVSVGSDGQSHKTVSTNHNLSEEKGEPKRYRTEVLPLTSLTPYRSAKPAHKSHCGGDSVVLAIVCFSALLLSSRNLGPCQYLLRDDVNQTNQRKRVAGIAQWLERLTRDRKDSGSSPCRSDGIIFFSRVNFLC